MLASASRFYATSPGCWPVPGTRTRRFYERMGFLPLEETHLWSEGTPCLTMVKPLTGWTPTTGAD